MSVGSTTPAGSAVGRAAGPPRAILPGMDGATFVSALRAEGAALAEAARLGLDADVPSCPGWSVADLVRHTGIVHAHKDDIVRNRLRENPSERPVPPADDGSLLGWYEEGAARLADLLEATPPSTPVWTWFEPDQTVGFWQRRMAHETAVHRVDAQLAHGGGDPVESRLAADGVDELLDVILVEGLEAPVGGAGELVHLHATDAPGEWLLELGPDRVGVRRGHAKGSAAARGTASDLLLFLWGRAPAERLETFGDAGLLARLRQLAAQATV